jgi:4-amino-4-deoxy-L-arabinose transferase-like glycosyltransferase
MPTGGRRFFLPFDRRESGADGPGAQPDSASGRGGGAWGLREAALIFALALLPRLAHWWFVRQTPLASEFVPDLSAYLFAAQRIMASAYFFLEPMVMSPGFSLLLAPQYLLFGPDVPVFALVNAVLDAASAVLCAGLAARLAARGGLPGLERPAGFLAGAAYALCGPLLFYALLPLGEGPAIFCLLLGVTLLFSASGRSRAGAPCSLGGWLAGILLALAALLRPNLAPAILLGLAAWGVLARREGGKGVPSLLGRCLLGFFLALSPFMAHNATVAGRASPFGFQGGFTLYSGNHPGASGVGDALPGFGNTPYLVLLQSWRRAEAETGRQLTLAEADAWWYARTWRFFADNPGEGARLLGRKALLLLNNDGLDATANMDFCARFSPVPGWLALPAGLLLALGAAGLALAWRRSPEAAALAVLLLGQAALVVLFQVTPRYRVVLLPLASIFVGAGGAELASRLHRPWSRATLRSLALPLATGALVLGLSLVPLRLLVDKPGVAAQEHARLARYHLLRGPQALAAREYQAALALGAPEPERLRAELLASQLLRGQDQGVAPLP